MARPCSLLRKQKSDTGLENFALRYNILYYIIYLYIGACGVQLEQFP